MSRSSCVPGLHLEWLPPGHVCRNGSLISVLHEEIESGPERALHSLCLLVGFLYPPNLCLRHLVAGGTSGINIRMASLLDPTPVSPYPCQ